MNIKAAIISIVVIALSSSSSSLVQGQQLRSSSSSTLRAITTTTINANHQEMDKQVTENDNKDSTRKLDGYYGHSCSFKGKSVKPGQWLQGPKKTCMCDRHGSMAFVACVANGAMAAGTAAPPPPGVALTALGARQEFQAKDFVFDLLGSVPYAISPGGSRQSLTVANLPSMAGTGVSYTLVNLEPCAILLPHVHPRATELIYVIHGKNLQTAFSEENVGRVIVNDIGIGETTFFPQGLIHYQQNLSCEPVQFLAALSSEDPGVVTITTQFFELPKEAVITSLNQDADLVNKLIAGLPTNPGEGRNQCLAKCGLNYSW